MISGARVATRGSVSFQLAGRKLDPDQAFKYMAFAAPYVELIEELTLPEFFSFHTSFKKMIRGMSYREFKDMLSYSYRDDQYIRSFSSGMKQRVKLAFALLSNVSLILLDEPCSNLDVQGRNWYRHLIDHELGDRTLLIASNDPFEFEMATQEISLSPAS